MDNDRFMKIEKDVVTIINRLLEKYEISDHPRVEDIKEWANSGEWGVALDMLVNQIVEEEISISRQDFESIAYANCLMDVPDEKWRFIEELVKDE